MYLVARPASAAELARIVRDIAERIEAGDVRVENAEQQIVGGDAKWTARFSWRW
jgi:hypothetical protein